MAKSTSKSIANGALVRIDPNNPMPEYIFFQFNPASLRRTLQPATVGGEPGGHSENIRFTGAPVETFSLVAEIDALADYFVYASATASPDEDGIYPQLYAMETLVYPKLSAVQTNQQQLQKGVLEIAPYATPQILLVWGPNRVVPVTISSYQVTEQMFDANLNPIRATVALEARALSYSDVTSSSPAYQRFMTYQSTKEAFAKLGTTQNGTATGAKI